MDGRTLSQKLCYTGMERAIRKLAVDEKMAPVAEIALMPELEVCGLVAQAYEMVYAEGGEVGLVRREDLEEYKRLVKIISR